MRFTFLFPVPRLDPRFLENNVSRFYKSIGSYFSTAYKKYPQNIPVLWFQGYIHIMTYSHTALRKPSPLTPNPDKTHAAYIAAVSPAVHAVIAQLLLWLVRNQETSGRVIRSAKALSILSALVMMVALRPGSLQKKALLESHFAKINSQVKHLRQKTLKSRLRIRMMWGGGLRAASLATLPDVFVAARDAVSFDALIPN